MKPIDFTKYPKILPYVKDHLNKSHIKPWEYNPMREETYIEIVTEWIDKFEKVLDVLVNNTYLTYQMTGEDTGYNALEKDWERWQKFYKERGIDKNRIDKDLIRQWWVEKFSAIICSLYTATSSDHKDYHYGVTGSLITVSFNLSWIDSDYKHVEKIAIVDMSLSLHIGTNLHKEIDQIKY